MSDIRPSEDVRRLIELIETYDHLGALLLLGKERRMWTTPEVGQRLNIGPGEAAAVLGDLVGYKLAQMVSDEGFRIVDVPPEVAATVLRLERIYTDNPVSIIREFSNNAIQRVRIRALHTFSDAFVLGKKKG